MKSITKHLIVNLSIWAIVVAFGSGLLLTQFFRSSAQKAFDEQLEVSLKIIAADLVEQVLSGDELLPPGNLGEPRFELPLSGWYWTVSRAEADEPVLSSHSLSGETFTFETEGQELFASGTGRRLFGRGPDSEALRVIERKISYGPEQTYFVRVTGNAKTFNDQVQAFQNKAWIIMILFSGVLLSLSYYLVKSALRPLKQLQNSLGNVGTGTSEYIEGDYPVEISGLVQDANVLIVSNRETLERARTQLGNLAHALKTPLSVITNEVRDLDKDKSDLLVQQANIMRDQIQLYLERARMAARRNTIGMVTEAQPVLAKLVEVMQKIHPEQNIELHFSDDEQINFRGERHDLEEMVGNLVDNASKWAAQTVIVNLYSEVTEFEQSGATVEVPEVWLVLTVEDDGKGMDLRQMQLAMQRGKRLDESKPGSGLGLSIVKEMATLYQGQFHLEKAPLGGVKAILKLPALIR